MNWTHYFRLVESDQETIEDPSTDEGFSSPESQAISLDNSQQYQSSCQTLREDQDIDISQSRIIIHEHEIPVEIRQGLVTISYWTEQLIFNHDLISLIAEEEGTRKNGGIYFQNLLHKIMLGN